MRFKIILSAVFFVTIFLFHTSLVAQDQNEINALANQNIHDLIGRANEHLSLSYKGQHKKQIEALPYTVSKGFRCQVLASSNYDNVQVQANKARALNLDSVYISQTTSGLYKVQVGNFDDRRKADALLTKLVQNGFDGAWVVPADIHQEKTAEEKQVIENQKMVEQELPAKQAIYYTIQVLATNDELKATELKSTLENDFSQPVKITQTNYLWKVSVGKFIEKDEARSFMKSLVKGKFNDAWITQISAR